MKQQLWKQLCKREQVQKKAHQVKYALRKTGLTSGLLQVDAPDPHNSHLCTMAFSKESLEQACLAEAQQHFTQAAQMPVFQLPPEKQLDSLQIGSPAFYQILDRMYLYHKSKTSIWSNY